MKIALNFGGKSKTADTAFFIYFTLMALFFTKTYIQLFTQLGIIAYVLIVRIVKNDFCLKKQMIHNEVFFLLWFGIFVAYSMLSINWAYSTLARSNTNLTLFRIFSIGVAIYFYVDDYNKAVAVVKSFIYSCVIMSVVILLTTPLSQYGKAGDEGFGNIIGQQRNAFAGYMTYVTCLSYYFYKYEGFKHGKKLCVFFIFSLMCSGSRGAMLQLLIIVFLYVLLLPGASAKLKYLISAIFIGAIVVFLLKNIPYLYEVVWVRFGNMISTVLGIDEAADSSAQGRELYKVLAYAMYQQRPVLGFGVDGFVCYLRDVKYINGEYIPPVYSHCNFTEIAANYGTVGLLIWYIPVLWVLIGSFKRRNQAPQMKMIFILLTSMVVLDYARIPWSLHFATYVYFLLFLLYLCLKKRV